VPQLTAGLTSGPAAAAESGSGVVQALLTDRAATAEGKYAVSPCMSSWMVCPASFSLHVTGAHKHKNKPF
jgi:hypothetical protein